MPTAKKKHHKTARALSLFTRYGWRLLAVAIILIGLFVRMLDLTDPPLDFNPTRQLLGAIVARGMYYQMLPSADPQLRETAIRMGESIEEYEPPVLNRLVALTYLVIGSEQVWIARIYSSIFWMAGGIALFLLARRMISERAAVVSLGYFIILPFAIVASRSFQVDPMMVMCIIFTAYAIYRWSEQPTWGWTIAAGLLAGITIFVKITAVFPVAGMAVAAVFARMGLRKSLKNPRVWLMIVLAIIPPAIYYLVVIPGRSSGYFSLMLMNWRSLLNPGLYIRWMSNAGRLVDLGILFVSLGGMLIAPPKVRPVLFGLWVGYGIYGLFFPQQMPTHDYYHLMLLPIIGLSLAPLAEFIMARLSEQGVFWRACAAVVAASCVFYYAWVGRTNVIAASYRHEPGVWEKVGQALPQDGEVIGLTHDYGYRLMYYGWRIVNVLWPTGSDFSAAEVRGAPLTDFEALFAERTAGMHYFLVTAESELETQPQLKDRLFNGYTLIGQGDSYLIFDLHQPVANDGSETP